MVEQVTSAGACRDDRRHALAVSALVTCSTIATPRGRARYALAEKKDSEGSAAGNAAVVAAAKVREAERTGAAEQANADASSAGGGVSAMIVLADFVGKDGKQMSMKRGDSVYLHSSRRGWARVSRTPGATYPEGIVPHAYLQPEAYS